jgi:hypothetical protein
LAENVLAETEIHKIDPRVDLLGLLSGFVTIIIAVFMLHLFKASRKTMFINRVARWFIFKPKIPIWVKF